MLTNNPKQRKIFDSPLANHFSQLCKALDGLWPLPEGSAATSPGFRRILATALLAGWLITGCSGVTPYEPRNHREEGPQQGVFTGSSGEFSLTPGQTTAP